MSFAAAIPILSGVGASGNDTPQAFTLGYAFKTGAEPLRVTSLGLWDSGSDGFTASHAVGLWNSSGTTLLAQVTVPAGAGSELIDSYRYSDLVTPVNLAPNTNFVIAAAYDSDDRYRYFGGSGDFANDYVNGGITITGGRIEMGSSLSFPTAITAAVWTGPNALLVVPEPVTTVACAAVTIVMLLLPRRRSLP